MATPGDENIQQSEDEDLSQELTEKLLHFQDVTGIEDLSRCKTILRQHAWDVAGAVQSTFTENDISNHQTNSFHNTPPPPATSSGLRHRSIAVGPPLPIRRYPLTSTYAARGPRMYPQGFFQWTYYILALPFRFTWTALFDVFRFVWRVFVPNPLLRVTDPRGDIATFINEYEEAYGTRHPVFFRGTYAEAQSESRRQSKYLLVYLHGPDHQDTPDFCLNVLSNEDTIELIQTNCIFWCCSVNKPEGYRVSRALQENTYPFLAMVCQYQGKMTVVGRMEGPLSPQEVIDQVSGIIERFEPVMIAARADRAERDMTQQLRNEQDQAYQESLLQDKEKEEKRRREEEAKKKKIEDEEEKVRRKEEAEEEYIRRKMRCKEELAPEPDSEDSNAIKILLKLPDGSRLTRRFFTTQPVKSIHDFVFCQDSAPRHFQIVTNFPLKIIPGCSTSDVLESEEAGGEMMEGDEVPSSRTQLLTIEEAGIKSAEILFVQSMDNDDSEEETSER